MAAQYGWNRGAKRELHSTCLFQKIYNLEQLRYLPSTLQDQAGSLAPLSFENMSQLNRTGCLPTFL